MGAIAGRSCPPARNALGTAKQPTDQHQDRAPHPADRQAVDQVDLPDFNALTSAPRQEQSRH